MKWWSSSSEPSKPSETPTAESQSPSNAAPTSIPDNAPKSKLSIEQELGEFNPIFAPDASSTPSKPTQKPVSTFGTDVYPTTMSCREAFDAAMHCRGPGGQFLNLYRYGEFRQCTEQWGQFWFCMRTRTKPRAVKEQLIQEWYREKEEKKYEVGRPSSEDVWEERETRLERAFDDDLSKLRSLNMVDTREWRRKFEDKAKASDVEKAS